MLHRGVPLGEVLRWALMGTEERISAATALRIGLVSEIVDRSDLWDRAQAIATAYKSGLIGVFADSDASNSEILFRNAQVWKL